MGCVRAVTREAGRKGTLGWERRERRGEMVGKFEMAPE